MRRARVGSAAAFLVATSCLLPACASRFERISGVFVYRVTAASARDGSCTPDGGAPRPGTPAFFVVVDNAVLATVIGCDSEEDCVARAEGRSPDAGSVPAWRYTLASFEFRSEDSSAGGPCRGVATTVRSNGVGSALFILQIFERYLDAVAREAVDASCSIDHAATLADRAPCTASQRIAGELRFAR